MADGVQISVEGIDAILANLQKEISGIRKKTLAGMIEASIIIQRDMEATGPKVPVDTGNLIHSWFTVTNTGEVAAGDGATFEGDDAEELSAQHTSVINQEKGEIQGKKPNLSMGFTANYAAYVHENTEANFKKPGSGAKFLESALERNQKAIIDAIVGKAKID